MVIISDYSLVLKEEFVFFVESSVTTHMCPICQATLRYRDSRPLTFLDTAVVAEAFLHHEQRKVDKGACISFRGQRYETKPALIGYTVEISYDPANPEIITISHPGFEPFQAMPVKIGAYCDRHATLPAAMQEQKPTTSRFLDALETKHTQSRRQMADAISFASYRKEVNG